MQVIAEVDQRTLREVYLAAFEHIVTSWAISSVSLIRRFPLRAAGPSRGGRR